MKTTIRFSTTESKLIREHKNRVSVVDLRRIPEDKRQEALTSYAREICHLHGIK